MGTEHGWRERAKREDERLLESASNDTERGKREVRRDRERESLGRTESRATVSVDGDSGPRERKSGGLGESGERRERESEGRQIRRE